ncbi:hypothetical protein EJ02DRAFT_501792 [Clathrospora elynae]|uniref:CFEM domain-containing protein n=1 Tax=Clathrospora elynae TaxID=706981 RepID=A0A6A5SVU8_9PLEO|nr:hypothetical protein EJ02DRAFT_501792 [Clathrospora elynae]
MLLSYLKRLSVSSVFLITSSPLEAAPSVPSTPSSLPQALQQNVPSCAQSCLRASLDERFPVACSGQESIACLCSRYSNMGESLGEVALGCVYLACPTAEQKASLDSAYGICLGQKDAVMPTKSALTYVVTSTPRTMSTSSVRSAGTTASIITSAQQTGIHPTQSAFVDTISSFPTATSSMSFTSVPAATAAEAPIRMTAAQIAGLSVAAVAAFVMAIGLMALSVCLRRRRERRFILNTDEKGLGQRQKSQSARFSHYVQMENGPEQPTRFLMVPPPARRKGGIGSQNGRPGGAKAVRPAQRLGVGTSNNSSESSLPLSQIGMAISAELDGNSVVPKKAPKISTGRQRPASIPSHLNMPFRPVSTMTQETVFEEDEMPACRRSSMLLPTPPVPIPPIRALQPSRTMPTFATSSRRSARQSELFLNIPIRHERPQPKRVAATEISNGSPQPRQPASRPHLAPPFQMTSTSTSTSYESKATTASSRDASQAGDIIDYYFTSNRSQNTTPKASPALIIRPKESTKSVHIKPKTSHSTVSSRTSTNIRDSVSSQTSFETMDPNDPTPEDEDDDKQLSDDSTSNKPVPLSPVAESPISKLRYPKVPRASNQLVPRSPKSPPPYYKYKPGNGNGTSRRRPDPSTLLSTRDKALPPLLLESRRRLNSSPQRRDPDPFTSPPPPRSHVRSSSAESWSSTPASKLGFDRKSRVQSGAWGKSPVMYEEHVVQPLNVRRKRGDEMAELNVGRDVDVDAEGVKSPVWIPRLTPTRKGGDLFISVGWGEGSGRR